MKGPVAVAETFRDVFLSEQSGTLEVRSGETSYSILFDRGIVAGAAGGPPLSEFLLQEGKLSSGTLVEIRGKIGSGEDPIPLLIQRGELTPESVAESAERLGLDIVENAFSCVPEKVDFFAAPIAVGESHGDIIRTMDLFLCGVRAMSGFEAIREALLRLQPRLTMRLNPAVPLERLTLQPIHGFLLSRLDGTLSFRDIVSTISSQDEDEAARFIFSLMLMGTVVLDPPIATGLLRSDMLLTDYQRDRVREESEIAFIRDAYAALQSQNPYQMLAIAETAKPEEIQTAYEQRRDSLAPDRFLERVREQTRSELRVLEARLAEAYLALRSPGTPQPEPTDPFAGGQLDYDALALRREVTKTEVAATLDEQERLAESYFLQAKKFYGQADYHNCIQYLTLAIRHSDRTARYHVLMGDAQARNPDRRWQKMAEQSYMRAAKLDPWNADYLVTLGQFYRRQGFASRARRQFDRALEIQPDHPKAKEELGNMG